MDKLAPTDPATASSMTDGTTRWHPDDAYSQAFGNKPEYSRRVRGVGKNVRPVPGTTLTYYTPTQARSQRAGPSTAPSQEEINQAVSNISKAFESRISELQTIIETQRKAAEEHLARELQKREEAWESRWSHFASMMTPSAFALATSHDALAPVTGDPSHRFDRSSVGSASGNIFI
jgi:hypothetical protein